MRTWAVALTVAVAVAGACSRGEGAPTGPTVPTGTAVVTTTSTSTTVAPESYDVPEVIDQAYVQKVVSAYDKVLGDAIRVLKRDGGISEEFLKHLLAIYTEQEFEFQQRFWIESIDRGVLHRYRSEPGNPTTTAVALAQADGTCVVAEVEQSFAAVLSPNEDPGATPQDDYVVLVPKPEGRDPLQLNPTPWSVAFSGFKEDNSVPLGECG